MSDDHQVAQLKEQVRQLKKQIEDVRKEKSNSKGFQSCDVKPYELKSGNKRDEDKPKTRRMLKGHFGKVYAMHWGGNSEQLVSASQDGKLIIWNGQTTNKIQAIPLRSSWVMTCAFEEKENELVACGGLDNLCSIYNIKRNEGQQAGNLRAQKELSSHDGYLSCCRFMDPGHIITSSGDSTCLKWNIENCEVEQHFNEHSGDVMSVAISPTNENVFVSGSCDSFAMVWDVRTGKAEHTLPGHDSDINSVAFFPDGHAFGTGSDDSSCRLFDIRAINEVATYQTDKILCGITAVAFSKTGRFLIAGYDDYVCHFWNTVPTNEQSDHWWQLSAHENRVSCLGVPKTGQALCTGSWDTHLKIWA